MAPIASRLYPLSYNAIVEDQFTAIAPIYDRLMQTIPYREWVEYVRTLCERERHPMCRVLDVGCGTGSASLLLAAMGVDVTGIDASEDMIAVARRKAGSRPDVRFLTARMEELDLPGRFDTAISLFDSVNYVTNPATLQAAFHRIYAHMLPGGLFLFDMNTPYALEMEMFTQDNLHTRMEPKYAWRSHHDRATRMTTVDMNFYIRAGGARRTLKETHRQFAYTLEEMAEMLTVAGFEVRDVFEAFTLLPPAERTDRAYFVAKRG